jgi:hypothetical protein
VIIPHLLNLLTNIEPFEVIERSILIKIFLENGLLKLKLLLGVTKLKTGLLDDWVILLKAKLTIFIHESYCLKRLPKSLLWGTNVL